MSRIKIDLKPKYVSSYQRHNILDLKFGTNFGLKSIIVFAWAIKEDKSSHPNLANHQRGWLRWGE